MDKLKAFIAEITGQANVGDTPENKGQCVGVSEVWIDRLGLPHVWGNAIDLLYNADKKAYTVVMNSPTNVPAPGDIMVLGAPYGAYLIKKDDGTTETKYNGHTGVVVEADVNTFKMIQQNDPLDSTPHIKEYPYISVIGWLHPNTAPQTTTEPATEGIYYHGYDITNQESNKALVDLKVKFDNGELVDKQQFDVQAQAASTCQTQLESANKSVQTVQKQYEDEQKLNEQVRIQKQDIQKDLDELELKYGNEQKEVTRLNTILESHTGSNKDYAVEAYESSQIATKYKNIIKNFMEPFGKSFNPETVEQEVHDIAVEVLSRKDNGIDPFLKELVDWLKSKNVDGALETLGHSPLNPNNLQDPGERAKIFAALEGVWSFAMSRDEGTAPDTTAAKVVEAIKTEIKKPSFLSSLGGLFLTIFRKPSTSI